MKFLLPFLLLISSLLANENFYVGGNYGLQDESFGSSVDAESSSPSASFKIGYGDIKAYAIELSYYNIQNSAKIFSYNDSSKNEINLDLVKAYDFDIFLYPFFKVGFGTGYLSVDRILQNTLHYGVFDLGLGVFIPVAQYLDIELGYKYKFISYETIDTISERTSYNSTAHNTYIGFNIRF